MVSLNRWARRVAPSLYHRYVDHHKARLLAKVAQVLSDPRKPIPLGEAAFDALQGQYEQWWPQYDFDSYNTGRRAYERAISFLRLELLRQPGRDVLEVACGDGMSGTALSVYGHQITLLDYEDWRDSRALGQLFIQADMARPIMLPDATYDFIFSFNAFEHIPNPALATNELVRLLRPGGAIWLDFNPLYGSPLGMHAFSFRMPYPQFLFSDELIQSKLKTHNVNDLGRQMETLQPLNRWRPSQFRELWRRGDCTLVEYEETTDFSHLPVVLQYAQAFRGRGLLPDDLVVSGMHVVLQKH